MSNFDKTSCDEINTHEIQQDSETIKVLPSNKEEILEFCIIYYEGIIKQVAARQMTLLRHGKMMITSTDENTRLHGQKVLSESTLLAKKYRQINQILSDLKNNDFSCDQVSDIFENLGNE